MSTRHHHITEPLALPGGETYAVKSGQEPFDWKAFLRRALTTPISEKEHEQVCALSKSWVTCACGNQCAIIERNKVGRPFDDELAAHGTTFHYYVTDCLWRMALVTLNRIEARSAKLIAELTIPAP